MAFLCSILFLLSTLLGMGWRNAAAKKWAQIVVADPEYDYGTVPSGSVIIHEFEVQNRGSAILAVKRVVKGCACTSATISANTIMPGKSARLRIALSLAGIRGEKVTQVALVSNDPKRPVLRLEIRGRAASDIDAVPEYVSFGIVPVDRVVMRKVRFVRTSEDKQDTKVLSACHRALKTGH